MGFDLYDTDPVICVRSYPGDLAAFHPAFETKAIGSNRYVHLLHESADASWDSLIHVDVNRAVHQLERRKVRTTLPFFEHMFVLLSGR